MVRLGLILGLLVAVANLPPSATAQQGQRLALVIGNGTYAEAPLKNPVNDARAMTAALRSRGFDVITRENATKSQMEAAVADFGEKLAEGATGLFFFAGHGMQVSGRNFLLPVDAKITSEQRVRLESLDVDMVLDQMQGARTKVSMVILDACRNNPFERRFRSVGGGLAQINAPEGTLIAYATAPGKVAADGDGTNGLYTQEFLKAVAAPGLKVEDVFKQVRINVSRASNGMQVPWEASSLTGDFYFVAPPPPSPPPSRESLDQLFWEAVKSSNSAEMLQAYLDTFPNGTFAPAARTRMASLAQSKAAPAPVAPVTAEAPPRPGALAPPTAPPPAPVLQQAALPSPAAPTTAGAFDGRYTGRFQRQGSFATMTIEITGSTIVGFAIAGGNSNGGVCRMAGSIDVDGVIQKLDLNCAQSSWTFSGRFTTSDGGTGETAVRGVMTGSTPVTWKKISP